jgi:hypothetical protein
MSQFSEHDPSGQTIKGAAGIGRYERSGWRRWLVPAVAAVIAIAAVAVIVTVLAN